MSNLGSTVSFSGPLRVLAVIEQTMLADLVKLNLSHSVQIDIFSRRVRAGSSDIHLTGLEQSLLYLLAARAGQMVTREEIIDAFWGSDYIAESKVVDRHVRNLRAKLQDDWRKPRFIATDPGRGYRFVPVFSDSSEVS